MTTPAPPQSPPRKLGHVVTNAISNAAKYVPAGRGGMRVAAHPANGHVTLCVQNGRTGIAAACQQGIFELFAHVPSDDHTVDGDTAPDTGVERAIVERLLEAHHGRVGVESEPGAGAAFYLRPPAGLRPERGGPPTDA